MNKAIVIEVEGRGAFPVDMLRYDCCSPRDTQAVSEIESSHQRRAVGVPIRLNCWTKPTPERWRSFGWTCKVIE